MKDNKTQQQEDKYQHNYSQNPTQDYLEYVHLPVIFTPEQTQAENEQKQMDESCTDHRKERLIVNLSNAAIYPNAVMVEFGYASGLEQ